jgi:hypothetical protein
MSTDFPAESAKAVAAIQRAQPNPTPACNWSCPNCGCVVEIVDAKPAERNVVYGYLNERVAGPLIEAQQAQPDDLSAAVALAKEVVGSVNAEYVRWTTDALHTIARALVRASEELRQARTERDDAVGIAAQLEKSRHTAVETMLRIERERDQVRTERDEAHIHLNNHGIPNTTNPGPEARLLTLWERLAYMVPLGHHALEVEQAQQTIREQQARIEALEGILRIVVRESLDSMTDELNAAVASYLAAYPTALDGEGGGA